MARRMSQMPLDESDYEVTLTRHDTQISNMSAQMGIFATQIDRFSSEMHELKNMISGIAAKNTLNVATLLDGVVKMGAIIAAVVGGIIYITQSSLSGDLTSLHNKDVALLERIESQRDRIARLENILIYKGAKDIPATGLTP